MSNTIPLTTADGAVTIKRDQRLSLHTTFRIGGPADYLARVSSTEQIVSVLDWARPQQLPVVVIPGADHFFHRRLPLIKRIVVDALGARSS